MAYADSNDLIVRYDERTIRDLLSDTGTPVADLAVDAKLKTLLREATGKVNAAIRVGNIYSAADIAELFAEAAANEGSSDEGDEGPAVFAVEYLKGIVCQIVMAMLLMRRPEKYKKAGIEAMQLIEENYLDPLRDGQRLLDMDGRASTGAVIKGDEITRADVHQTRPITNRTQHFYPLRENQLPKYR